MAALSAACFLVKCKGALYPCNYENEVEDKLDALSLAEMCSDAIVKDAGFTKQVLAHIPTQIYYLLMKRAVNQVYHRAISTLISTWPFRVITLKELWPLFSSFINIYDNNKRQEFIKNAATVTTVLINSFVKIVKNDEGKTVLRILDLRGFPIMDRTLKNLSCALQTLINDEGLSERDKFHIFVDCTIRDDDTYLELLSAIAINSKRNCKLSLHITKMDISCVDVPQLADLLGKLEPNELTAVSLQFNSLGNDGFIKLQPILATFQSITALDLSCNNLQLPVFMNLCNQLAHVNRLDLSNNRLSNCLVSILPKNVLQRLEYLKLSACLLKESDLNHLHTNFSDCESKLCELDLSENSILSHTFNKNLLSKLFKKLEISLHILEMEDCLFTSNDLPFLINYLLKMKKLQFINLARHQFTSICMLKNISQLGSLPSLKCIRISYPEDCYQDGDNEFETKKTLSEKIDHEINKWRERKVKIMWI